MYIHRNCCVVTARSLLILVVVVHARERYTKNRKNVSKRPTAVAVPTVETTIANAIIATGTHIINIIIIRNNDRRR